MTKKRPENLRYLQKVGNTWYCRVKVPRKLQAAVGSTHIRRSLHTTSLPEANELKWAVVPSIRREIYKATTTGGKLDIDAKEARAAIQEARADGDETLEDIYTELVVERAERLADQLGAQQAKRYLQLATSRQEPLTVLATGWLRDTTVVGGTRQARAGALHALTTFLGGDTPAALVNDDVALDLAEHLRKTVAAQTARNTFTRLSSLWQYLWRIRAVPRGTNPWVGHEFKRDHSSERKRAFTDTELVLVLQALAEPYHTAGTPRRALVDLVILLLSSACRAEEVAGAVDVTIRDGIGWLAVQARKGKAIKRVVPVLHPAGLAVLARRPRGGPLFPDVSPRGPDQKRHILPAKSFGQLKTRLKLPTSVDMHSLRRNALTVLEQAGADPIVIARYAGQTAPSLALSRYSAGASEAQMVATARLLRYSGEVEALMWRLAHPVEAA